jgi:hypothetical protein
VSEVLTDHVTRDIRTQQEQRLVRTVRGGWAAGEKTAIKQWEASR